MNRRKPITRPLQISDAELHRLALAAMDDETVIEDARRRLAAKGWRTDEALCETVDVEAWEAHQRRNHIGWSPAWPDRRTPEFNGPARVRPYLVATATEGRTPTAVNGDDCQPGGIPRPRLATITNTKGETA